MSSRRQRDADLEALDLALNVAGERAAGHIAALKKLSYDVVEGAVSPEFTEEARRAWAVYVMRAVTGSTEGG